MLFGAGLLRAGSLCTGVRNGLRTVVLLPARLRLHRRAGVGDPPLGVLHDLVDGGPEGHRRHERAEAGGEDRREQPLAAARSCSNCRYARAGQSLRAGVSLRH